MEQAKSISEIMRKQSNDTMDNYERQQNKKTEYISRHPDSWQPCVFLDAYLYKNKYETGCDYKDVLYKIPPVHKVIDTRNNEERYGVFLPAGDIQIELWKNLGNDNSSDNMHLIIQEVDNYSNGYVQHRNETETDLSKIKFTGFGFNWSKDKNAKPDIRTKAADNTGEFANKVFEKTIVQRILDLFKIPSGATGNPKNPPYTNLDESSSRPLSNDAERYRNKDLDDIPL